MRHQLAKQGQLKQAAQQVHHQTVALLPAAVQLLAAALQVLLVVEKGDCKSQIIKEEKNKIKINKEVEFHNKNKTL